MSAAVQHGSRIQLEYSLSHLPETVHEPIDGKDELETIGGAARVENRVVRGNDQDKGGGRHRSGTDTTNSRNDDQEDVVGGIDFNTIEVGKPDTRAREVDWKDGKQRGR